MSEAGSIKVWVLAFVLVSGAMLGALIGIGCAIGANACPFGNDAITSTTGRELFIEAACIACHGPDGGGTDRGPSLIVAPASELPLAELIAAIESGSPGLMPRFEGKLTRAQIETVARYVVELRGGSP